MSASTNSKNLLIALCVCMVLAFGVHKAMNYIKDQMQRTLVVHGGNIAPTPVAKVDELSHLYPVAVKTTGGQRRDVVQRQSLDLAFRNPPAQPKVVAKPKPEPEPEPVIEKESAPPPPDLMKLFVSQLKVVGLTEEGAFVEGRYMRIGESLRTFFQMSPKDFNPKISKIVGNNVYVLDAQSEEGYTLKLEERR